TADTGGEVGPEERRVGNAGMTLGDAASTLNVAAVTSLAITDVAAVGGTMNFSGLSSLNRVRLSATGGGRLLFPAPTTYADGVQANYTIQASGTGSKIDLSHLSSMAGSEVHFGQMLTITADTGGEV